MSNEVARLFAKTHADGTASTNEVPHPKCPNCGQVFEGYVPLPWDGEAVFAAILSDEDGDAYLYIAFGFKCRCGYVLHCELSGNNPPYWWGQMGADGPRQGLVPDDYIAAPEHPDVIGAVHRQSALSADLEQEETDMNHRKKIQMQFIEENQELLSSAAAQFWKQFGKGALHLDYEDIQAPPWQPFPMHYLVGKKLKRNEAPEWVLGLVERYDPATEFVVVVFGPEVTNAFRFRPRIPPQRAPEGLVTQV